ncbi:MAG: CDP-alcohol phosphatidyltransferase family protein [Candidatus Shapirobacteria bacterium]|nr:CDP-alcohol phosphatidyltransferase family protein [Candidatus Shapirobacteria bacterium]
MNTANKLTVSRILLIPIFLVLVVVAQKTPEIWRGVAFVYLVSGLTDLLDGRVARSQK